MISTSPLPLISDENFNSLMLVVIAFIGIVPTTLAAYWSRQAKSNSVEAKVNSAGALHEVKANGGMSDPDPTLKDYIVFVGENVDSQGRRLGGLEELVADHIRHSQFMDQALARVFLHIRPDLDDEDFDEFPPLTR